MSQCSATTAVDALVHFPFRSPSVPLFHWLSYRRHSRSYPRYYVTVRRRKVHTFEFLHTNHLHTESLLEFSRSCHLCAINFLKLNHRRCNAEHRKDVLSKLASMNRDGNGETPVPENFVYTGQTLVNRVESAEHLPTESVPLNLCELLLFQRISQQI